ncbi:SDR family NAD(P)-dependent oxidoreductase [Sphingosinithalassobacter sp. CS137]|uniref:SDR family NAD(P)-dependent oxidoreductase n=1 Tax=Sphingosinithalassobacter sp. CS137 TaxID=2762748 RepID=UPI0021D0DFC8|nr:SDR family oxidoreductase [Sphingosinithalassobacter sp. CS137]
MALAERGHDLILTARRAERLEDLAQRLRSRHGVAATTIPCDLARTGAAERLIGQIAKRGLAVNLLVNNAGFGFRGPFVEMDPVQLARMVDLNCRAVMELCRLVLPGMVQMRSGAILNVASVAAVLPGPWMASYYATKAFVLSLSEALHEEVRRHGVSVSALCPGPVATEFGDLSGLSQSALFRRAAEPAEQVVRAGLTALDANRAVAFPGARTKLVAASTRLMPRGALRRITGAFQQRR